MTSPVSLVTDSIHMGPPPSRVVGERSSLALWPCTQQLTHAVCTGAGRDPKTRRPSSQHGNGGAGEAPLQGPALTCKLRSGRATPRAAALHRSGPPRGHLSQGQAAAGRPRPESRPQPGMTWKAAAAPERPRGQAVTSLRPGDSTGPGFPQPGRAFHRS